MYTRFMLEFEDGDFRTAGGGVNTTIDVFQRPLGTRNGDDKYCLRLWLIPRDRSWDELSTSEYATARSFYIQAVGSASALAVETRTLDANGQPARYQIGRKNSSRTPDTDITFNMGHEVHVQANEVFDADDASQLFWQYHETGKITDAEYELRPLKDNQPPDYRIPHTHILYRNGREHKESIVPNTARSYLFRIINRLNGIAGKTLSIARMVDGEVFDTPTEQDQHEEFLQTTGIAAENKLTVEVRQPSANGFTLYTLGHQTDTPNNQAHEPEITIPYYDTPILVYPNETFGPDEVADIFDLRTNRVPETYTLREIAL